MMPPTGRACMVVIGYLQRSELLTEKWHRQERSDDHVNHPNEEGFHD
jgi:hypothetical protein